MSQLLYDRLTDTFTILHDSGDRQALLSFNGSLLRLHLTVKDSGLVIDGDSHACIVTEGLVELSNNPKALKEIYEQLTQISQNNRSKDCFIKPLKKAVAQIYPLSTFIDDVKCLAR